MKKQYSLLILFLLLFMGACKMRHVSINTLRPAEINIPSHIQSITLLDRTEFEKKAVGVIEGILTGEGINEDQDGVIAMFSNMRNSLASSPRFSINVASERLKGNTVLGSFPEPLNWATVSRLGRKYNTDAILAVEVFDSDFIVTNGSREKTKTVEDQNGNEVERTFTEYYAEGVGNIRIGIRLYDIKNRNIIDQDIYTQNRTWEKTASSVREAVAQLIQKSQATKYLGGLVGSSYASKIAPMPIRVSRSYYAKPKSNMYLSRGARQAEVNQWEEAVDSWKAGINNSSDVKTLGRLAYNIALGYEILGDFYTAHLWAGRSWIDYGEKRGRSYAATLEGRMRTEEILDEQLKIPEEDSSNNNPQNDEKPTIQMKVDN